MGAPSPTRHETERKGDGHVRTWVNISAASKDDPWGEGCRLVEEALDGVIGSECNEVEDTDAGATISFFAEDNLLKAIDALVARFGEGILFWHKDVA